MYGYTPDAIDEFGANPTRNTANSIIIPLRNVGASQTSAIGNPYLQNVSFDNIEACNNSSCTGAISFKQAVINGWFTGNIYYESTSTTAAKMICNATVCNAGDTPAILRPWWGVWIENGPVQGNIPAQMWLRITKPAGLP